MADSAPRSTPPSPHLQVAAALPQPLGPTVSPGGLRADTVSPGRRPESRASTLSDNQGLLRVDLARGDSFDGEGSINPVSQGVLRRSSHAANRRQSSARRGSMVSKSKSIWAEKLSNIVYREEMRARGKDDSDSFDLVASTAAVSAKQTPTTLKQKVNAVCEPSTSFDNRFAPWSRPLAIIVSMTGFVAIILNVVMINVESLPQYYKEHQDREGPFFIIESVCVAFFTIEWAARFTTTDNKGQFIRDPLNLVDLVAIIPYYLQFIPTTGDLAVLNLTFLRVVRLVRVLRVLKVGKISENLLYVQKSLNRSMDALYLLFFLIVISTVLLSSAMYLAETASDRFINGTWYSNSDGELRESKFQSIPHTFWWALVTLCTVGYGDVVPMSPAGKTVAAFTMLAGTLVVAFPVILIGANFNEVVLEKQKEQQKSQAVETISELKVLTNSAVAKFAKNLIEADPDLPFRSSRYDTPREVVEGFLWRDEQRFITARWSKALPSVAFYDYDPLFDVDTAGMDITECAYNDSYVLSVPLYLDRADAQVLAHTALGSSEQAGVTSTLGSVGAATAAAAMSSPLGPLGSTGPSSPQMTTATMSNSLQSAPPGAAVLQAPSATFPPPSDPPLFARTVTFLGVAIVDTDAHPDVALLVSEFHNPRRMVTLNFTAANAKALHRIIDSLMGITVRLSVEEKEGATYDVTLPISRGLPSNSQLVYNPTVEPRLSETATSTTLLGHSRSRRSSRASRRSSIVTSTRGGLRSGPSDAAVPERAISGATYTSASSPAQTPASATLCKQESLSMPAVAISSATAMSTPPLEGRESFGRQFTSSPVVDKIDRNDGAGGGASAS